MYNAASKNISSNIMEDLGQYTDIIVQFQLQRGLVLNPQSKASFDRAGVCPWKKVGNFIHQSHTA